jgi:hypothetical protein
MVPFSLKHELDMSTNQHSVPVLSLRANVSREDAVRAFRARTVSSLYWRAMRGPLWRLALSYVPFCLYHVQYNIGTARHSRWFALDRVQGILDLFEFPDEPSHDRLIQTAARNCIPPSLSKEQVESILHEKVLRIIFQQGFFRVRETGLQVRKSAIEFSMPYWLGFYGQDGSLRCRVLDAVRRRMEGEKAAQLFENWLAA